MRRCVNNQKNQSLLLINNLSDCSEIEPITELPAVIFANIHGAAEKNIPTCAVNSYGTHNLQIFLCFI